MRQQVKEREIEELREDNEADEDTNICIHYWLIERAQGHISHGICKICGEEQEFLNSLPDYSTLKPGSGPSVPPGSKEAASDEEHEEPGAQSGIGVKEGAD